MICKYYYAIDLMLKELEYCHYTLRLEHGHDAQYLWDSTVVVYRARHNLT